VKIEAMSEEFRFEQTRLYKDLVARAEAEVKKRAYHRGQASMILIMLSKKLGEIPDPLNTQITALSLEQIAALTNDFFNLNSLGDLANWLQSLSPNQDNGNLR